MLGFIWAYSSITDILRIHAFWQKYRYRNLISQVFIHYQQLGFIAAIIQNKLIDLKIRFQSKETGGVPNEGGYGYIFQTALTFFREKISAGDVEIIRDIFKSYRKTMFQSTYFSLFGHNQTLNVDIIRKTLLVAVSFKFHNL